MISMTKYKNGIEYTLDGNVVCRTPLSMVDRVIATDYFIQHQITTLHYGRVRVICTPELINIPLTDSPEK